MADASKVEQPLNAAKRDLDQSGPTKEDKKEEATAEKKENIEPTGDDNKNDDGGVDDDNLGGITEEAPIFKNSHEIKFKWNKEITELKDCDTKHMLYLLHLALIKVRERTIERNKHFKSLNREDRIQKYQDNPAVITRFIEWHNKDADKNKFDGNLLQTKQKKDFTNDILTAIGGTKMGWSTKIYHYLTKEVKIDDSWHTVTIPNNGYTKLSSDGMVLEECTCEQMQKLLKEHAFVKAKKTASDKGKEWGLEKHTDAILKYFNDNKIDGKSFKNQPKKGFNSKLLEAIDSGNKRLNGPLNKLYGFVDGADLNSLNL